MNIQLGSIPKIKKTNRRFHPHAKDKGFSRLIVINIESHPSMKARLKKLGWSYPEKLE